MFRSILHPLLTYSDGIVEGFVTTSYTRCLPVCRLPLPPPSYGAGTVVADIFPCQSGMFSFDSLNHTVIIKLS